MRVDCEMLTPTFSLMADYKTLLQNSWTILMVVAINENLCSGNSVRKTNEEAKDC